jgi:hypothetical protein
MSSSKGQIRLRLDHKALKRTARRYKQKVASGVLILQGAHGELSAIPMILRRNYRIGKEWTVADGSKAMDSLFPIKRRTPHWERQDDRAAAAILSQIRRRMKEVRS